MKFRFKSQRYQTEAVNAVVDCFAGQPLSSLQQYRIDPGKASTGELALYEDFGMRNAPLLLPEADLLSNIRSVQQRQGLPLATGLITSDAAPKAPNLDIEMETGTGKTYVYIKTMMELHRRYGWSKFIVVVPSIAIREGVMTSFEDTAEHFQAEYGTKPRAFIYDSTRLHEVERFSTDSGVQVMIINVQAFNAAADAEAKAREGKRFSEASRRIFRELDDFQSRRPIDVIAANRPIVIIDEPQKIGEKSEKALAEFNALMVLRYSATHRREHNKVHLLDAISAYNAKLVKKIAVRGITVQGLAGTSAYLYVDSIKTAKGSKPTALLELEVQGKTGTPQRRMKQVKQGTNLYTLSGGMEAYTAGSRGLIVTDIDAIRNVIELSNGDVIPVGVLTRDDTEDAKRRIQMREAIRAHLDKERELFGRGIKVLSLFFIDEVAKYRDYERADTLGDYARIFEEEYAAAIKEVLGELALGDGAIDLHDYLQRDLPRTVHQGYFSIDKKSGNLVDPAIAARGDETGQATDVDAYDLILKDKKRLLSLDEPVRFLFSHSALREGWDNPNVFVMGMLKRSDNTISRRQEIGRGLRIAVDQNGDRMDDPLTVHDINQLTVVTDESYTEFVDGLQREIAASLSSRPTKATEDYFRGKSVLAQDGTVIVVDEKLARLIHRYLDRLEYLDEDEFLTDKAKAAIEAGALPDPEGALKDPLTPIMTGLTDLLKALMFDLPAISDGRATRAIPLNDANFQRKEFQDLWRRINHKAVYQVDFDSSELVRKCVAALDSQLQVTPLTYVVITGEQDDQMTPDDVKTGTSFRQQSSSTHVEAITASSHVRYDLIGEITEKTQLTRKTAAAILTTITPESFAKYRLNPEQFISEAARIINEQKAAVVVEHLVYDTIAETFDTAIFTENQIKQDLSKAVGPLTKSVFDYVMPDSNIERAFAEQLDTSNEVVVFAKLPRGFFIPTPMGNYNPDWAIAFKEGSVHHVYFVAETKGSLSSLQLKGAELAKIECARRFFATLSKKKGGQVAYGVATDYSELMGLVGVKSKA